MRQNIKSDVINMLLRYVCVRSAWNLNYTSNLENRLTQWLCQKKNPFKTNCTDYCYHILTLRKENMTGPCRLRIWKGTYCFLFYCIKIIKTKMIVLKILGTIITKIHKHIQILTELGSNALREINTHREII